MHLILLRKTHFGAPHRTVKYIFFSSVTNTDVTEIGCIALLALDAKNISKKVYWISV